MKIENGVPDDSKFPRMNRVIETNTSAYPQTHHDVFYPNRQSNLKSEYLLDHGGEKSKSKFSQK